jgi:elongation factor G
MPGYAVANIRNIALLGHSAAGKTSLGEALMHKAGVTNRLGHIDDGTSLLDYDDESKDRRHSVDSSVFYLEHGGALLNIVDTPGAPDYCGTAIAALAGVETAVVVVSAAAGIGVNTRRMFNLARESGLACILVVNKIDAENVNLEELVQGLTATFGPQCRPLNLPCNGGKSVINVLSAAEGDADLLDVETCHTQVVDAVVETDEALMEEYMSAGSIAEQKLRPAVAQAVARGLLVPILFTNARAEVGIAELLDVLTGFAPSPVAGKQRLLITGEGDATKESPLEPKADAPFVAQVFKITTDPKSNIRYSVARVFSGTLKADGSVFASGDRKGQRSGHVMKVRGNQHADIDAAIAGDIVALAKIESKIGVLLLAQAGEGTVAMPKLPTPMFALALEPRSRADVEKIGGALHRFAEEDPCFEYHRDPDTGELVIQGMGDQHLTVVRSRMKRYFKLEVDTKPPKIPYRETISTSVKYVEYTHKKQTGGAGQFARVFIDMEPNERGKGYEFIDKIFGGVIDQPFRPSVDKGVREQMKRGVLAGYPVVDVKVSLVDGKTHPVDSKDIAFQIAGRQVFKKAFMQCRPILLEPIVSIEVTTPTSTVGEITRDLAGKRGSILGQDMLPGDQTIVRATVPLAEVANYSSQLKSVTGGQGSYVMEFNRYDVVPPNVQQQIVAAHKPGAEEEE